MPHTKEQRKAYYEANKEYIKQKSRDHYAANRERHLEQSRKWCESNPEKSKEIKQRYANKPEAKVKKAESSRLYKENNRESLNTKRKVYRNAVPSRRISDTLNSKLYQIVFKGKGKLTCVKFTGCTREELLNHLESQFKDGMSWENHGMGEGKWQIDHIVATSLFDLTKPEQVKSCYNFKNLQPLWCFDNNSKHNKIETCPV